MPTNKARFARDEDQLDPVNQNDLRNLTRLGEIRPRPQLARTEQYRAGALTEVDWSSPPVLGRGVTLGPRATVAVSFTNSVLANV